jgi:hypothetical protein
MAKILSEETCCGYNLNAILGNCLCRLSQNIEDLNLILQLDGHLFTGNKGMYQHYLMLIVAARETKEPPYFLFCSFQYELSGSHQELIELIKTLKIFSGVDQFTIYFISFAHSPCNGKP